MISKILRLFVHTFTAYDKYSVLNREYITHPIHMQISQKQRTFSQLFFASFKSRLNFEHIEKKDDSHISCVSEIRLFKNVVR